MKSLTYLRQAFESLVDIIYPRNCQSCGNTLFKTENIICLICEARLPLTNSHLEKDNAVEQLFWGRCTVHSAAARHVYQAGGKVQHLIHQLKYKNKPEIGVYLGELYGRELSKSERFNTANLIIPVPLHLKKLKSRGYNQSEKIAEGLAKSMHIILDTNSLIRKVATETQTRKNRWERYKNTKEIFAITDKVSLENKHLILVDDVITTGSTIEGCVNLLSDIKGVKISVVALASAAH